MKAVRKIVLLSAGLLSPLVASATSSMEQVYLETCRKDPEVPVPIAVVSPTVGAEYNGSVVQLEFVVREDGRPAEFSIRSTPDDLLAKAVVEAVKQWRFQPAEFDGKPVAKKCALPVKIVGDSASANRFAAFD